ncbi:MULTISPECIES: RNA 2'-phosphotransferase [unclassified Paenibacillus]|uniref:RNA 2'-phosphotransferase n=1 Tax=unclassified Paenibacillus TaxID=185978 RepID=UPI0003E2C1AA|nr:MULTISPECIES: RNA 2'-phosphotransferase [unclassified Paenibacillus]ETT44190.1 RNA 2'-phosphotransferase [Paenibacillus sp. FSL R7-269]OMF99727.1 RNA 2'-phosphotransferase [Paenibacillus sp. FSL R7-0337]
MDYAKLSKEVSYALRHAPWEYELELDEQGWVDIEQLLHSLHQDKKWEAVGAEDLDKMIAASDKQRHELAEGRIRALYGHSVPRKIIKQAETPPPILYHGTARQWVETILHEGLKPMKRQYVHFSVDTDTAKLVGGRKDSSPVILTIDAGRAAQEGIKFYHGNHNIWLADHIPPQFIAGL